MLCVMVEMENLRKCFECEKFDVCIYVIEKFVCDLLSVLDNMVWVLEVLLEDEWNVLIEGGKGLFGGIEMMQKELYMVLICYGVIVIEVEFGVVFDLNFYQVVVNILLEYLNGMIVSLFQVGWKIGDCILCVVMVVVSVGLVN